MRYVLNSAVITTPGTYTYRLTCRMSDSTLKGKLTPNFVIKNCEIGLLKKEEDR